MSTQSADQFLMGGGVQSAKFENVGDSVAGDVHDEPEVRQQTDLSTGALKFWDDGRPQMQLVVTLKTSLHDDADDDGLRKLYIKGKYLTEAVREAVRKAGAKGLEVGGRLQVTYTGDGPQTKRGFNPPKLYRAEYARPTSTASQQFLNAAPSQDPEPPF